VPDLAVAVEIPPSSSKWRTAGKGTVFKYKDLAASADGAKSVLLKAGTASKAKILVKAKGPTTPLPGPVLGSYFTNNPSVIVQLVNGSGESWSSEFVAPAQRNDVRTFEDKLP